MSANTWPNNGPAGPDSQRLERTVAGFFDYIENIIENRRLMHMADIVASVDRFLDFNEYRVLDNRGHVSKKDADRKALSEYAEFNKTQKIESDFDRFVKERLPRAGREGAATLEEPHQPGARSSRGRRK